MLIPVFFFLKPLKFHIVLLKGKPCKAVRFSKQRSSENNLNYLQKERALIDTFTAFSNLTALRSMDISLNCCISHILLLRYVFPFHVTKPRKCSFNINSWKSPQNYSLIILNINRETNSLVSAGTQACWTVYWAL